MAAPVATVMDQQRILNFGCLTFQVDTLPQFNWLVYCMYLVHSPSLLLSINELKGSYIGPYSIQRIFSNLLMLSYRRILSLLFKEKILTSRLYEEFFM